HEVAGVNSRLDELQAAFLRLKLPFLDDWNRSRQTLADRYSAGLEGIRGITIPTTPVSTEHVYHLYVIQCEHREKLQQYLTRHGVTALVHYPVAPYDQKVY